jgi:hypothetical protein
LNGPPPTEDGDDDDVGDEPYLVSCKKIREVHTRNELFIKKNKVCL